MHPTFMNISVSNNVTSPYFTFNPHATIFQLKILAISLAVLQFIFRLGCISEYGFHQDELLYMAMGDHLAWGFKETPPFIALLSAFTKFFIGNSVFAMRVIPAICAALIVFYTGKITILLGGKWFAVLVACTGIAFSSAFLASGALFIPQVFDELCWVLVAYFLLRWIHTKSTHYLLVLGVVFGIGLMVKYTMALYAFGLLFSLALNKKNRQVFANKHFWYAIAIALLLVMPNLIWQIKNGFPALKHYAELKETQLVYISHRDFIVQQLFANGSAIAIWLAGVFVLLLHKAFVQVRFLVISFILVNVILLLLHGKPYYAFGAYPPLFAAGGLFYEQLFTRKKEKLKWLTFSFILLPNLILMFVVLPYLPIEQAAKVFKWTYTNLNIHFPLKWEDQKIHNMNQNYADMIGWEELAQKTANLYHSLPSVDQANTIILTDKYGEAGAIDYYQEIYRLPKLVSLNSSYAIWAPQHIRAKHIIYIGNDLLRQKNIGHLKKYDEITNPYARIKGMGIYLLSDINPMFKTIYATQWQKTRLNTTF